VRSRIDDGWNERVCTGCRPSQYATSAGVHE
jgi:hypothetical protein